MHSIGRIRVSLRLQKNFSRNPEYTSIIYRVLGILLGSDYKSNANELTWISQFKKRKEKWWWISLWLSLGQMFIWWFYRSKWVGPTWAGLLRKGQDGENQELKLASSSQYPYRFFPDPKRWSKSLTFGIPWEWFGTMNHIKKIISIETWH